MSRRNPPVEAEPIDAHGPLTLGELCRACDVQADHVIEFVEIGLIEPQAGRVPTEWRFPSRALLRLQRAVRLHRDLGVEPHGAALALDLIEEVDDLRRRVRWLEGRPPE